MFLSHCHGNYFRLSLLYKTTSDTILRNLRNCVRQKLDLQQEVQNLTVTLVIIPAVLQHWST